MHRRTVDRGGANRVGAKTAADNGGHRIAAQRAECAGHDGDGIFLRHAGHANGKPVQHQSAGGGQRRFRDIFVIQTGDALAEIGGQAHGAVSPCTAGNKMQSAAAKDSTTGAPSATATLDSTRSNDGPTATRYS